MQDRPLLAITLGDPNGIGPEVVARALEEPQPWTLARPLVIGSAEVLEEACARFAPSLRIRRVEGPAEARGEPGTVEVLDPGGFRREDLRPGQVDPRAGRASMEWALLAGRLALEGQADGVVTAPLNKEAVRQAGYPFLGHLEAYQALARAPEVATMLMAGRLRVVHLTTHRSLRDACDAVTRERVLARIRLTHREFVRWGFARPRIAVSALNPHASDGGLLGTEEQEHIAPAVEDARREGIDAVGPVPADIIFYQALQGRYDAVLAMYHDQGHIPVKVHRFEESVSLNLGLPFLRTSVDHGTAFDIAWKGVASHRSMAVALRLAGHLARHGRLEGV